MSLQGTLPDTGAKVSLFNDPAVRGIAYQVVVALVIVFLFYEATSNAVENLRAAKIASGFGFMENTAGFDINQTLIHFSSTDGSTYGRAFYVGLLNTLLVSSIAIVTCPSPSRGHSPNGRSQASSRSLPSGSDR